MRVARLDIAGEFPAGLGNVYVTDKFTEVTVETEIAEGEEVDLPSACGAPIVSYKDCDRIRRVNISLTLGVPDPELHELLAGGTVLTSGNATGYAYPRLNESACPFGSSLEIWTKHIGADGAQDSEFPYLRWVFPRVYLQIGSKNFENAVMASEFEGFGVENGNWDDGPMNDWPASVPVESAAQFLPVATMPEAVCGPGTVPAETP